MNENYKSVCVYCGETYTFDEWNVAHKYGQCASTFHPYIRIRGKDVEIERLKSKSSRNRED